VKIVMKRHHGAYKPGEVVDLPDNDARALIAWEYASEAPPADKQQTLIETASVRPIVERADVTPRRK